uniref:Uncharacterized protein n=1 Tax=Labrus bergylta TaxID=56723 RepID=A0A3Q3FWJ1_9LABR
SMDVAMRDTQTTDLAPVQQTDSSLAEVAGLRILGNVVLGRGVVTLILTPALLALFGFTSGGIAAGSIAAKIMSWLGIVYAGSVFAFLQSIGATGLTWLAGGYVASFGGAIGWMLSAICNQSQNNTTST